MKRLRSERGIRDHGKKKEADIDEQFDWHMTHGTYQMRAGPRDKRRSD